MRPSYLEIKETAHTTYELLWKLPVRGDRKLPLVPRLPYLCQPLAPAASYATSGAQVSRWTVQCEGGLAGQRVEIAGLDNTFSDVLARVEHLDGAVQTVRIKPGESAFTIQAAPSVLALSGTYLWLGVEHIWLGIDHLLFVFALLHGFGFAGALAEVGLPQQAIPLALLFFNLGVEIGQLVFGAAVLALGQLLRSLGSIPLRQGQFAAS